MCHPVLKCLRRTAAASRGSSGEPGSKISRLIWSASASGTPWAENTAVTVDLPQPLRPVMPKHDHSLITRKAAARIRRLYTAMERPSFLGQRA